MTETRKIKDTLIEDTFLSLVNGLKSGNLPSDTTKIEEEANPEVEKPETSATQGLDENNLSEQIKVKIFSPYDNLINFFSGKLIT